MFPLKKRKKEKENYFFYQIVELYKMYKAVRFTPNVLSFSFLWKWCIILLKQIKLLITQIVNQISTIKSKGSAKNVY